MATLYLLCGKIASGKSTLAAELAERDQTLLISEDFWLSWLFGPEMREAAKQGRFSRPLRRKFIARLSRLFGVERCEPVNYGGVSPRLREAMSPHLVALLRLEISVVLDFPANSRAERSWMKKIAEVAGASHQLHYLDVSDEECRARLRIRNASGTHEFSVSDDVFVGSTRSFEAPAADEGFRVIVQRPA